MKHKFNEIEIRIEKITDRTDKVTFYWCYAHVGNKVRLIGKSKTPPPIKNYDVIIDN